MWRALHREQWDLKESMGGLNLDLGLQTLCTKHFLVHDLI